MFLEVFWPSLLSLRSGVFPEASTTTWAWSFIKKWNKYVFGLACNLHFVVERARVFTFQKIRGSLELTYIIFKTDFTDHSSRLFFCLPTLHSWLTNPNLSAGMEVTPCIWYNGQVWESNLKGKKKPKCGSSKSGFFFALFLAYLRGVWTGPSRLYKIRLTYLAHLRSATRSIFRVREAWTLDLCKILG